MSAHARRQTRPIEMTASDPSSVRRRGDLDRRPDSPAKLGWPQPPGPDSESRRHSSSSLRLRVSALTWEYFFVVSRARKPIGPDFHGRRSSKASTGNTCTKPAVGGTFDALKWRGRPEIPSKGNSSLLLKLPGAHPRSKDTFSENVLPMSCLEE